VEGAEFPILEHLHREGTDALVAELLVEWHDEKMADDLGAQRVELTTVLRCPVRPWDGPRTTLFSAIRGRWKSRHAAARGEHRGAINESRRSAAATCTRELARDRRRPRRRSGFVLGSIRLTTPSLWVDEAFTTKAVRRTSSIRSTSTTGSTTCC
jgi:hypothetical protein